MGVNCSHSAACIKQFILFSSNLSTLLALSSGQLSSYIKEALWGYESSLSSEKPENIAIWMWNPNFTVIMNEFSVWFSHLD